MHPRTRASCPEESRIPMRVISASLDPYRTSRDCASVLFKAVVPDRVATSACSPVEWSERERSSCAVAAPGSTTEGSGSQHARSVQWCRKAICGTGALSFRSHPRRSLFRASRMKALEQTWTTVPLSWVTRSTVPPPSRYRASLFVTLLLEPRSPTASASSTIRTSGSTAVCTANASRTIMPEL